MCQLRLNFARNDLKSLRAFRRVTHGLWCLAIIVHSNGIAVAGPLDAGSMLCLDSIEIPVEESVGKERRADLEKRLSDALIAASYQVRDAASVKEVVDRVKKESGGVVDPATGQRDKTRYDAFSDRLAAALHSELGCDARLSAQVVVVHAPFQVGTASWDGAKDSVSSAGRVVLQAIGGRVESGWVAALSLWLRAYDLRGKDLAFRSAGIESLVSLAVVQNQDVLPPDVWLTDSQKVDAAIRSALGPNGEALRLHGTPDGVWAPEDSHDPQQKPTPKASGSPLDLRR
jgi:hypothetical protein